MTFLQIFRKTKKALRTEIFLVTFYLQGLRDLPELDLDEEFSARLE